MLDATGAHFVFGLSAGAVIALETAFVRPDLIKLVLYEPPLSFDGVVYGAWVPRYEKMLASGKQGNALVAVLKDTADRNSITRYLPQILIAAPLNFIIKKTENRTAPPARCHLASSFRLFTTTRRLSFRQRDHLTGSPNSDVESSYSADRRAPAT
jgi:pimeloyl-ACP methyl ester carboxylesterase